MLYFLAQFINKTARIITVCLLFILSFTQCTLAANKESTEILVLNSYHFGYQWSDEITQGIRDKINTELPQANIYIEYMDSKHFDIDYTDTSFFELLKKKHSNYGFDIIISCDDDASYFVFRHYENLYQGIPVVFCGVNQWMPELVFTNETRREMITGLLQKTGFAETFELAKKLNNKIDKVMIISDSQSTGLGFRNEAVNALSKNEQIKEFIDINGKDYTTAQMYQKVMNADDHTAVIYCIWSIGKDKKYNDTQKVAQKISQIAPVPVYATSDVNIRRGLLGGKITRGYSNGQAAAEMALKILNGTSPKTIPIVTEGILEYAFNKSQLEKWNIKSELLPESYTIIDSRDTTMLFSSKEQKWLKNQQIITVATIDDNPYMKNGDNPSGIAIEYLKLISEITNLKIRYQQYDSLNDYIMHLEQPDPADICIMAPVTKEYEDIFLLTDPWIKLNYSLFVNKKQNLMLYTGLNSIEGKTIAVINDDALVQELKNKYPRVNVLYVPDYATGFKAVTTGNVYGFLIDHSTGVYQANSLHVEQNVTVAPVYDLPGRAIAIGVSRRMPELYDILVKASKQITETEIENIRQKYCQVTTASPGIDFIKVIKIGFITLLLFTLIITAILIRLRFLKKALEKAYNQLQNYSDTLEQKVTFRTKELNEKNHILETTLVQLKQTQSQLIIAEKMGALGHLIAGIAHEINSPLGAINSAREVLHNDMFRIIQNNRQLAQWLIEPDGLLLEEMLNDAIRNRSKTPMSTREKRESRNCTISKLSKMGIDNADTIGRILTDINLHNKIDKYMKILNGPQGTEKIQAIANITDVFILCETIEMAVDKASRIIYALKNYIRGNSEPEKITKTIVDMRKSIDTVVTLYYNTIKNRAKLNIEYQDDLPPVIGNPDEINQIWSNIIQNAVQAINGNDGLINISVNKLEDGVVVAVKDNGSGMNQETQKRIFEPMFTTKPAGEGTGLGMTIVKKIVCENHQGKIDVLSQENDGTTIYVWLPSTATAVAPDNIITK